MTEPLPQSVDETLSLLRSGSYIADRSLATALYLSLSLGRPLFLEGEAGVGKTEIAKVLSAMLGRKLLRLQCYEGLDISSAVYEWDYPRQMIEIRLAEAAGDRDRDSLTADIFSEHPSRPTCWKCWRISRSLCPRSAPSRQWNAPSWSSPPIARAKSTTR
jgi:MoxR-like ATPase